MSGWYVVKMRTVIYGMSHDFTTGEVIRTTAMGPWAFWSGASWVTSVADAKRLVAADAVGLVVLIQRPDIIEATVEEVA